MWVAGARTEVGRHRGPVIWVWSDPYPTVSLGVQHWEPLSGRLSAPPEGMLAWSSAGPGFMQAFLELLVCARPGV